jgi:uncharacterized protein (DUF4213/DUF364 family)
LKRCPQTIGRALETAAPSVFEKEALMLSARQDPIPSPFYQNLAAAARPHLRHRRVEDFAFGLGLTVLRLDNGRIGCALMMREEIREGCCHIDRSTWIGKPAEGLLDYLDVDAAFLDRSLAIAAVNAAAPSDDLPGGEAMDSSKTAVCSPDEVVAMVGLIPSLLESLQRQAKKVYVFDNARLGEPGITPSAEQTAILPACHRVWATGATLVNGSIEGLMGLCRQARSFTLVGPSTPMYPEAYRHTPVTALAGCRWHTDQGEDIFRGVARGGSIFYLKSLMDKVHLGLSVVKEPSQIQTV